MSASIAARAIDWRNRMNDCWPGLLLAGIIAIASAFIAENRGGPTLLYALLLGMALNTIVAEGAARPGVDFAARRVLRVGVALLGARITAEQIGGLGWYSGGMIFVGVLATIAFGVAVARLFGLSHRLGALTGGATAICGASAAIALASVLPQDEKSERELLFTVAGITALSTAAMVLYPIIVSVAGLDPRQAGIFLGGTIHDVAQVVGAGYSVSPEVGDVAVLAKMLRVALLLPIVTALSLAMRRRSQRSDARSGEPLLPVFLVAFAAFVLAGSLGLIPQRVGNVLNEVSRGCLVLAIAAVGLKTTPLAMKQVGARAFILLGVEAVFLAGLVLIGQTIHGH